ncbi:MAG: HIT family protein [Bacteroidetes bacterium]|nr:HIT family protein [Bacteroidota bacterium]
MSTIFSKIINRELPAYIIHEDEDHLAFLDINPLKEGHTLVIPKEEIDYIFDMTSDRFQALFAFSKEVAKRLKAEIYCKKIGIAVIGLEVSHAHIHLIPINSVLDMNFSNQKQILSREFAENLVKKLKK